MVFINEVSKYRGFSIAISVFEHEADRFDDDGFTSSWVITSNSGDTTIDRTYTIPSIHKTSDEALQVAVADAHAYIDVNVPE